jgi:hypothetical protein
LSEANDVVRYVALDCPDAWANFSPTNVKPHTVSAAVALVADMVARDRRRTLPELHPFSRKLGVPA